MRGSISSVRRPLKTFTSSEAAGPEPATCAGAETTRVAKLRQKAAGAADGEGRRFPVPFVRGVRAGRYQTRQQRPPQRAGQRLRFACRQRPTCKGLPRLWRPPEGNTADLGMKEIAWLSYRPALHLAQGRARAIPETEARPVPTPDAIGRSSPRQGADRDERVRGRVHAPPRPPGQKGHSSTLREVGFDQ